MPYRIEWRPNGLIWTYSGVLTGNELLNSNFEIFGDERFDDLRYQIVDLTAVDRIEVNSQHMRKIAHLDMAAARTNPKIKVAVVSTTEDGAGLSHSYNEFTKEKSPWQTKLFESRAEAEAWANSE